MSLSSSLDADGAIVVRVGGEDCTRWSRASRGIGTRAELTANTAVVRAGATVAVQGAAVSGGAAKSGVASALASQRVGRELISTSEQ